MVWDQSNSNMVGAMPSEKMAMPAREGREGSIGSLLKDQSKLLEGLHGMISTIASALADVTVPTPETADQASGHSTGRATSEMAAIITGHNAWIAESIKRLRYLHDSLDIS